jgi:colanic acid/amylovoran biosynthesis protein
MGIVREAEVDAVLDASGFAFGDQHPLGRTLQFAEQVGRWAAAGKPVVLLPQALGPFESPEHAEGFRRIAAAAGLVFARDTTSLKAAQQVCNDPAKLSLAPDFTNLLKPRLSVASDDSRRACIVPNQRMLEYAKDEREQTAYLSLLVVAVRELRVLGLEPVALQHGDDDSELIKCLQESVEGGLPVQVLHSPFEIKRFIGECHVLIGSRFHALVSALSQGVPALATSWSHKYEELFADYGLPEVVLDANVSREALRDRLEKLVGENRKSVVELIRRRALELERQTQDMWRAVDQVLALRSTGDTLHSA